MFAGIVSILKAIPVLFQVWKVWEQYKDSKIKKHYAEKKRVLAKVTQQIKEAETDEERKRLIVELDNISSM